MTLPIAHIFNGELGFDVRTKLNDLIDLAGGGSAPFTPGSVPFADASGFFIQDNANFFWDDPNNLLTSGVGLKIKGATSGIVTVNTKAAAGTWTLTLPDTAGTSGYALTTNGSGVTSWTSAGGGGMAIGSPVTSGTSGSILYVDSGTNLAQQNANLFFDDPNNALKIGPNHTYNIDTFRALYRVANGSGDNWFEGDAGNPGVTGYENFGTGSGCLLSLTTGYGNTGVGVGSMNSLTTGANNFAFGTNALRASTTGSFNVAVGPTALQSGATLSANVAIGASAMQSMGSSGGTGDSNIALGAEALFSMTNGGGNIAIGKQAGYDLQNDAGFLGNVMIGNQAGRSIFGANYQNTLIGSRAGFSPYHLNACTIIGVWQGPSAVTLSNVIAINDGAGVYFSTNQPALDWNFTNSNIWSFRRLTNAQGLHVYNTQDDLAAVVDYERAVFDWRANSNVLTIGTQAGGTGTLRLTAITGFPKAGAPAAGDLPANSFAVIDDTSAGQTWLVFNKAGTIRKVQLT